MNYSLISILAVVHSVHGFCNHIEYIHGNNDVNFLTKTIQSKFVAAKIFHGQTFCFQIQADPQRRVDDYWEENTIRYEMTYIDYIETYEAELVYNFSIPLISATCKCYCPEFEQFDFCTGNSEGRCSSVGNEGICVPKFFHAQSTSGCKVDPHLRFPRVCCSLITKPYLQKKYTAAHLKSPHAFARIQVKIIALHKSSDNATQDGEEVFNEVLDVLPNIQNRLPIGDVEDGQMKIMATIHSQLAVLNTNLKYFTDATSSSGNIFVGDNVHLKSFSHIGWMYYDKNNRLVLDNENEIKFKHNVGLKINNCMEQQYTIESNAWGNYLTIADETGEPTVQPAEFKTVDNVHRPVLKSAKFVHNSEGSTNIEVVRRNPVPSIDINVGLKSFLHFAEYAHESFLRTSKVVLVKDSLGNKYMQLTTIDGMGQFLVEVWEDEIMEDRILSFFLNTNTAIATTQVFQIPLPVESDTAKYVCVSPQRLSKASKMCRYSRMDITALPLKQSVSSATINMIECPACSKEKTTTAKPQALTAGNWLSWLNPFNWFKGEGIGGKVASIAQIIIYLVLLTCGIAILRKYVIPCISWSCSSGSSAQSIANTSMGSRSFVFLPSMDESSRSNTLRI